MNFFDRINAFIEESEGSFITLITALIPWLAPALPAYLTWYHLTGTLDIPGEVAAAMALTVEFLGLSAVSTAFASMRHNKTNQAQKNKVSLAFPIGAYIFYILVVVVVNIVQEIPMDAQGKVISRIVSIGLLTLISAPAFVIAIARDQQRKIEQEVANKQASKSSNKLQEVAGNEQLSSRVTFRDWRNVPHEHRLRIAELTASQIQEIYFLPERTSYGWKDKAIEYKNKIRQENSE